MNIRDTILEILATAINSAEFEFTEIILEHPQDILMGDYATPVALSLAKKQGKNPREVAEKIVAAIPIHEYIEKIEIAGPGFVNFYLTDIFYKNSLNTIMGAETWGSNEKLDGKKYLIEHTSLNLFKPFGIGHLVNNSYANSLVKIIENAGADVTEVSFPSDISPGIAKGVWAIKENGWQDDLDIRKIGEAYAHGSLQFKESEDVKQQVNQINKDIYNQQPGEFWDIYQKGKNVSMKYFENMLADLGTKHDDHLYETLTEPIGKELVKTNTPAVFTESEGAIIFEGSKYGLFDNVFINSAGFGTYLAKDLGLIQLKKQKYPDTDRSITITDIEQKQHFLLVKKAAEMVFDDRADNVSYIQHGRLRLPSGRISSRDGGVPLVEDILLETEDRVRQKGLEVEKTIDQVDVKKIAYGALRYSIVKNSMGKNIIFDFEKDLAFEGNTGPYLQYTYVRTQSVLQKIDLSSPSRTGEIGTVTELDRLLYRFPEVVEKSLDDLSPHHIAVYLHELASAFNSFYGNVKIADPDNPDFEHNVALTVAVGKTLQNGLALLGIETVEKM